jgi:hypothetical protein
MTLKGSDLPLTATSVHYWVQRMFDDGHWHDGPGFSTTDLAEAQADFEQLKATGWNIRVLRETRVVTWEVLDV